MTPGRQETYECQLFERSVRLPWPRLRSTSAACLSMLYAMFLSPGGNNRGHVRFRFLHTLDHFCIVLHLIRQSDLHCAHLLARCSAQGTYTPGIADVVSRGQATHRVRLQPAGAADKAAMLRHRKPLPDPNCESNKRTW